MQVVVRIPGERPRYMPLGDVFSIGRHKSNTLSIPHDSNASRNHAMIAKKGKDEYYLSDLGSTNGTFLNNQRVVGPTLLKLGDKIDVGDLRLEFIGSKSPAERDLDDYDDTIPRFQWQPMCLLLVDVVEMPEIKRVTSTQSLAAFLTEWQKKAVAIIQNHGGTLTPVFGEPLQGAFFKSQGTLEHSYCVGALLAARELVEAGKAFDTHVRSAFSHLGFRVSCAVHHVQGRFGAAGKPGAGSSSLEPHALQAADAFRRIGAQLGHPIVASQDARQIAEAHFHFEDLGFHDVECLSSMPVRLFAVGAPHS